MKAFSEYSDKLNMVCNFTTNSDSLLSDPTCPPEIYLVSGHTTCHVSSLPATVTAKKLAEIHVTGAGHVLVDVTWPELDNTCLLIVR